MLKTILFIVAIIIVAYIFYCLGTGLPLDTIFTWAQFKTTSLSVIN